MERELVQWQSLEPTTGGVTLNELDVEGGGKGGTTSGSEDSSSRSKDTSKTNSRIKSYILFVACVAACGGLLFGLDLGATGGTFVMDSFRYHFQWDCPPQDDTAICVPIPSEAQDRDKGFISLFFGIGATIGSIISPYFAENYGRRFCLGISTVVYIVGASLQTYAPYMWVLWCGRLGTGSGIGMLSMCGPVYTVECAPRQIRGSLGIWWDLATTIGILFASAANLGLKEWENGWRVAYGSGIFFASLLLVGLFMVPESPRWLAEHGTEHELTQTLLKIRWEEELEEERETLYAEIQEKRELGEASWGELLSKDNMMRRRVLLGFFFFAVQQLSGGTAVSFYAPEILNTFFSEDHAFFGTMVLALIMVVTTSVTAAVVDYYGRTKLLVYGGASMCMCLITLAVFSSMEQKDSVGWAVLACSALFYVFASLSWGPAVWLVCAEMFPYRTRGKATGITTTSHWLFFVLVGTLFPMASSASLAGCFIFFAVFIFVGSSAVYFLQVETTGMTSAEIDEAFRVHTPTLKRKDW